MLYLKAYAGCLVVFLALDMIWLRVVTRDYYPRQIGHLMAEDFNLAAAAVFYLIYLAGIVYLAVAPASGPDWTTVALRGAVLGLVAYGTYGFTNLAVMKQWPLAMTLVDTAWGVFLTAAASVGGWWAARLGS